MTSSPRPARLLGMIAFLLLPTISASATAPSVGPAPPLVRRAPAVDVGRWADPGGERVRTRCCVFHPVGLDPSQIRSVTRVADEEAGRIREALGLEGLGAAVQIYITAGRDDFNSIQPGQRHFLPWVGGVAYPGTRTLALHLSHFRLQDVRTTLIHELAHVYVAERSYQKALPRWFDEGAAMLLADEQTVQHLETVFRTAAGRGLPTLAELERSFPKDGAAVQRAYAVSHAFLRWAVAGHGGTEALARILDLVAKGVPFETAMSTVLGESSAQLEARWNRTLSSSSWLPFAIHFSDILWILSTLLFVFAAWSVYRKRRKDLDRMEAEELASARALAEAALKMEVASGESEPPG